MTDNYLNASQNGQRLSSSEQNSYEKETTDIPKATVEDSQQAFIYEQKTNFDKIGRASCRERV